MDMSALYKFKKKKNRVAQDCVHLGFEYLQGGRLHNFCKQPVPTFDHPHH